MRAPSPAKRGRARPASAPWWQSAVIYQVYPRSFQDSDGNGVGDLAGVRRRLGYLADLGIDAVWISPFYPSPMADFGYDISDFTAVDPLFGTMKDFDALLAEARRRGLRVILDFVPDHSSDRHTWFRESRRSRKSAKRDWYIWRDPGPDGGVPNNWLSEFGGPAWTLDPATGQYYLHSFLKQQPDLNWRNPDLRDAMHDAMRFWLDRGIDGFRLDALPHAIKDAKFRDNPPDPAYRPDMGSNRVFKRIYNLDRPEMAELLAGLRRVAEEYPDKVLIGEAYLPMHRLMRYYGAHLDGIQLPLNFGLIGAPWNARALARQIEHYEAAIPPGAWPSWVLGNHDRPRVASRLGADQARLAAVLLLTLRGTPTLYYGDELGMVDAAIPASQVRDPWERRMPGLGFGRDPVRTPMRWTPEPKASFTTGRPWLPMGPDLATVNVAAEGRDPASMLSFYRRLLALRRKESALALGTYAPVKAGPSCLGYLRERAGRRILVLLNLGRSPRRISLPAGAKTGRLILSTDPARPLEKISAAVELAPVEGVVIRLG